jgi:DNA invertase Pin-like site-specific DNA recombinase
MKTLRVALCARVSTADQQTLPLQISSMRDYAERRGWTVVASIEDIGSGAKDRPKRAELLKMAKRRQVDVVLVWRLDLWGRSLSDLMKPYATLQRWALTLLLSPRLGPEHANRARNGRNAIGVRAA